LVVSEVLPSLEDQERADLYGLLAALLLGPDAGLVQALAALPRGEAHGNALACAWDALIDAAQRSGEAVLEEFDALFFVPGTPRVDPYQCYYRAGGLMDKPLAQLRDTLHALGLQRAPGATELEDHLGALCDTMRVLIEARRPRAVQQRFFDEQIDGWTRRCLHDIASAPRADFYGAVARFAQAFFDLESAREQASRAPVL
jgi:TorA maturation chaperone TorD